MKAISLISALLLVLVFVGAGCGDTTTTDTTTTDDTDTTVEETTTETTSDSAITVTQPVDGDTISSPFAIKTQTTKTDQTLYIRVLDADGNELVTAEGDPNDEGVYNAPYVIFFGGEGDAGTVEFFHKDGTTETDLVSVSVTLE